MKFENLSEKSILVTGGAGFIGSEYIRRRNFFQDFKKIWILDKLTYAADLSRIDDSLANSKIELIQADLCETSKYRSAINEADLVVHFAAESHVDRSISNGLPFVETNVVGTYSLLEAARNSEVERVLVVSTDEVYGSIQEGEASENSPLNPSSAYSATKAAADLIALAQFHTYNQDIVITRSTNNYGKFQNNEKFIPNMLHRLLNNQNVALYGDGSNIREWLHISDHVSALDLVLKMGDSGAVYNIGSGMRISNRELTALILAKLSMGFDRVQEVEDRQGHDFRYSLDSTKIRNGLGWRPTVNFDDGIRDLIDSIVK
jgi:dTDP-glucose 4,6-dehydratase